MNACTSTPNETRSLSIPRVCLTQPTVLLALLPAAALLLPLPKSRAVEDCAVTEYARIEAPDGGEQDYFGRAVALSDDVAVAGAYHDDPHGSDSGSAYAFRLDGAEWVLEGEISPADGEPSDQFGFSLALDGDMLVVGAHGDDDRGSSSGSAYVFRRDPAERTWIEEAKLLPEQLEEGDSFGQSVAISGDTITVAAPHDDDGCPDPPDCGSGAVYVFRYHWKTNAWLQEAKLVPADAERGDRFGRALAIAGDVVAVSNRRSGDNAVYVYRRNKTGWYLEDKIPEPGESGAFGTVLAITQDVLVVGKPFDNENGERAGVAFVYRFDGAGWRMDGKLLASDGYAHDRFASAVAVVGEHVVVGAYYKDLDGEHAMGTAYLYTRDVQQLRWHEVGRLRAGDRSNSGFFGWSVAVSGDRLIASALNARGSGVGAIYAYRGLEADCNGNATPDLADLGTCVSRDCNDNNIPDECDIADGTSEDGNENGIPDECEGACCARDATCEDHTADYACEGRFALGVLCEDLDPPCVPGACCLTDGTCTDDVREDHCAGHFVPDILCENLDPPCVAIGACCELDGRCRDDVREDECPGGFYAETVCAEIEPPCVSGGEFFETYGTFDEYVEFLYSLAEARPDLAEVIEIGRSVEDQPLLAIRITGSGEDKPAVMYHGAQHGNEVIGAAVVAYAAAHLLDHYDYDPSIHALVDGVEWYLLPVMNPDRFWQRRENANNRDLNRDWGPFTQPETAAMRDFFASHPNVKAHIDFHSFAEQVLWPWARWEYFTIDHSTFRALADMLRTRIASVRGTDYWRGTVYRAQGGRGLQGVSIDYTYGTLGIWAYVIEIGDSHQPSEEEIIPLSREMLQAMLSLSNWVRDCNENGTPDTRDIAKGTSMDCNDNRTPDECEAVDDCNGNGQLDTCDVADGSSEDENGNRVPDECECPATDLTRVVTEDWAIGDHFGDAVAVSETQVIVGAPLCDEYGLNAGAVRLFERRGSKLVEIAPPQPEGLAPSDRFGSSLAWDGDLLLIGAPYADRLGLDTGAVYAFRADESGWTQTQVLMPSDADEYMRFGLTLGISGNFAVIGALHSFSDSGEAYVYRYNGVTWTRVAKFADSGEFGSSVSISGNKILVGAPIGSRGAYVYREDGSAWVLEAHLQVDPYGEDEFGSSVSMEGELAVVGAPLTSDPEWETGAAYVFRFDGVSWRREARLEALDQAERDHFGNLVLIRDGLVFIGAERLGEWAIYVFRKDGSDWTQVGLVPLHDEGGGYGFSLASALGTVVIGAPYDSHHGFQAGTAFTLDLTDCNNDVLYDHCQAIGEGDFNADGRVDLIDFEYFADCLAGPEGAPDPESPECGAACLAAFDFDADEDVDLRDFGAFMERLGG